MPFFRHEKAEIARLKGEISAERVQLGRSVQTMVPHAKKAAAMGGTVMALKRFTPLLRPLLIAGSKRAFSKVGRKRIFKVVALGAAAFGAYKLLGSDDEA